MKEVARVEEVEGIGGRKHTVIQFLPKASKRQITQTFRLNFEEKRDLNFEQSKVSVQTQLLLTIVSNIDMTSSQIPSALNGCSPWTQDPRDRQKEVSKEKHTII